MNSELILQSDVLDLLFEKRNKLYGAYTLRKFYGNRLVKSISITLAAVSILCAFTFIPKKADAVFKYDEIKLAHIIPDKLQKHKKILPLQPVKTIAAHQKKFTIPLIVTKNNVADTLQTLIPVDIIAAVNSNAKGNEGPGLIGVTTTGSATGNPFNKGTEIKPVNLNELVSNPDILPSYPGGIPALRKFLERNLNNPTQVEENEIVSVNVGFVVGYDGKLQNFSIEKDGGALFNNEVIRVVKKMPQWIPGIANGKNVAVYFTIPVKFVSAD